MTDSKFSFRTFTSFLLAWSFVVLIVSGSILYIAPPGRIANWSIWRFGILTKTQWQGIHTLTAILFLLGGLFHLLKFNWKVFMAYVTKRSTTRWRYRRELMGSVGLFALVMMGTLIEVPPFSSVMALGENLKESWSDPAAEPPVPHMETVTLRQLGIQLEVTPELVLAKLKEKGMPAENLDLTLADLGKQHGRTPQEIYAAVREAKPAVSGEVSHTAETGSGLGFKTMRQVAEQLGMPTDTVLARLREHKLDAKPEDTVRTVASSAGIKPFEVVELLKK